MASHMVFCGSRVVVQHVHQHLQEAADHEGIRGSRARRVSEEQLIDEHVRSTRVCPGCTLRPNSFLPLGVLRSIQRMHACYFFSIYGTQPCCLILMSRVSCREIEPRSSPKCVKHLCHQATSRLACMHVITTISLSLSLLVYPLNTAARGRETKGGRTKESNFNLLCIEVRHTRVCGCLFSFLLLMMMN
jgi:hypothetical protein